MTKDRRSEERGGDPIANEFAEVPGGSGGGSAPASDEGKTQTPEEAKAAVEESVARAQRLVAETIAAVIPPLGSQVVMHKVGGRDSIGILTAVTSEMGHATVVGFGTRLGEPAAALFANVPIGDGVATRPAWQPITPAAEPVKA